MDAITVFYVSHGCPVSEVCDPTLDVLDPIADDWLRMWDELFVIMDA